MNNDILTMDFSEALVIALGAMGMGMMLLVRGGNWTVDAAIYLARHMGVSRLIVGLTIVAFGTSLPELIVSIDANITGLPGIALGNVIGSNVANILLVIGATACVATLHAKSESKRLRRDMTVMLVSTLALALMMVSGEISRAEGIIMVAMLIGYTAWQYRKASVHGEEPEEELDEPVYKDLKTSLVFMVLGLAGVALGAEFLIRGATTSARVLGVPDAVIGLSVIAVGTSLPELSTCLIAAMKKQTSIVLGNIIGSNIFNVLMIIGVTSVIKPIDMSLTVPQLVDMDVWVTLGVSLIFTLILLLYRKMDRFLGILFLCGYAAYIAAIFKFYLT